MVKASKGTCADLWQHLPHYSMRSSLSGSLHKIRAGLRTKGRGVRGPWCKVCSKSPCFLWCPYPLVESTGKRLKRSLVWRRTNFVILSTDRSQSLGGGGQQAGLKNRRKINPVGQWSPTFSAPGTNFIEYNFPWTRSEGMVTGWFKHITFIMHFISNLICCHWPDRRYWSMAWRLGTPPERDTWVKDRKMVSSQGFTGEKKKGTGKHLALK